MGNEQSARLQAQRERTEDLHRSRDLAIWSAQQDARQLAYDKDQARRRGDTAAAARADLGLALLPGRLERRIQDQRDRYDADHVARYEAKLKRQADEAAEEVRLEEARKKQEEARRQAEARRKALQDALPDVDMTGCGGEDIAVRVGTAIERCVQGCSKSFHSTVH